MLRCWTCKVLEELLGNLGSVLDIHLARVGCLSFNGFHISGVGRLGWRLVSFSVAQRLYDITFALTMELCYEISILFYGGWIDAITLSRKL